MSGGARGRVALLLLLGTGACRGTGAPPAGEHRSALEADALSAVVDFMAARAGADSVIVLASSWAGLAPARLPPTPWERIRATPGLDPAALDDFARANHVSSPIPRLHTLRARMRHDQARSGGGGALRLRLSRGGISPSGEQVLVAVETACGVGCAQGELFVLRLQAGQWVVASAVTLFIS